MIILSLLFIIICIFVYETVQNIYKLREEYFANQNEHFILNNNNNTTTTSSSSSTPDSVNGCKTSNYLMAAAEIKPEELDTVNYARFKPLLYNPKRDYYWNRKYLFEEGLRRNDDDLVEISKVKELYDNEKDEKQKQIYKNELNIHEWRETPFLPKSNDGTNRQEKDIITDYDPTIIGFTRPWREYYSRIPVKPISNLEKINNIKKNLFGVA